MTTSDNAFTKPSVPKNSREVLSWLIFEPELLENYGKTLNKKQTILLFLRHYPFIALVVIFISFAVYLLVLYLLAIDALSWLPQWAQPKSELIPIYKSPNTILDKFVFLIQNSVWTFIKKLAVGLAWALS